MSAITGHNFIAGGRSAAGETILHSLDASTGETLPYAFHQATEAEVDAAELEATLLAERVDVTLPVDLHPVGALLTGLIAGGLFMAAWSTGGRWRSP